MPRPSGRLRGMGVHPVTPAVLMRGGTRQGVLLMRETCRRGDGVAIV